jgi:hypothetical protein
MESLPDADNEGSNSTFQKFPAKTRVRIQLFKSFPPRRGFELNFSKVFRQDEGSNLFEFNLHPFNIHLHSSIASYRRAAH